MNPQQFGFKEEAFEQIKAIVGGDSNLDKITSDFIRIEDANFALFNYVTEMNNQVETLQDSIAKLKQDIKEARGRGEEKERQQKEKLEQMEKKLEKSEQDADTTETKLQLMESVLGKLKVGTEDLYIKCQCGNTPVLSLLGDLREEPKRPFVNDNNIIMYLDMINEKIVELKGICQFLDFQEGKEAEPIDPKLAKKKKDDEKPRPTSAAVSKKQDDGSSSDSSDIVMKPMDVSNLKTRAFVVTSREKKEEEAMNMASPMMSKAPARKKK